VRCGRIGRPVVAAARWHDAALAGEAWCLSVAGVGAGGCCAVGIVCAAVVGEALVGARRHSRHGSVGLTCFSDD